MTATEYTNAYTVGSDRARAALLTARLTARNRTNATDAYKQSIRAAHRAGCTYSELAAVLDVSRQAIRQLLLTN